MSVLVDTTARFNIEFYYEELYDNEKQIGIIILNEFDNVKTNEELLSLKEKFHYINWENIYKFEGIFRPADHEEMSSIREDCSLLNHRNEKAMLWTKLFRPKVVSKLCTKWNLVHKDIDGKEIALPINEEVCRKMHEHVLMEIVNRWAYKVGAHRKRKIDGETDSKNE